MSKANSNTTCFHHRHYRYVRMMLRRYPKMRKEIWGLSGNNGVRAIVTAAGDTRSFEDRLQAAMFGEL